MVNLEKKRDALLRRREMIVRLMDGLVEEQQEVDRQLRAMDRANALRLDKKFYQEVLAPMLAERPDGMTSMDLLKSLKARGLPVKEGQLKTFLSRYGQKGLLERDSSSNGPGKWKVRSPESGVIRRRNF
ncbi:MAG: hypothetical protein KF714_07715 [Parvibaculum sp.]|nr:hypothetical protein [Parvibaculum sp.]